MPSIPNLGIKNIKPVRADAWLINPPVVRNIDVPVTVNIGTPIVLLPGCVNTHSLSNKSKTILEDDSNGVKIFCDANTPAFTPLDYDPGYKFPEPKPASVPPYKNPEAQKSDESIVNPEIKPAGIPSNIPTAENKKEEKITEEESDESIVIKTEVKGSPEVTSSFLPTPQQVATTATIAFVATSSALLAKPAASILLKLIKPTIKKIQKKVLNSLGKKTKVESLSERVQAQRVRNQAVRELRVALKK